MRVTILEFTPCADSIFHVRRDPEEGYLSNDGRTVTIGAGTKLRPRLVSTYAGGKATNVARVIDSLLGENDAADIELIVFRPDSAEGRYIHDLQTGALRRVQVRPVIIEGGARFCIDVTDPATTEADRVEFNISPRVRWTDGAFDVALGFAKQVETNLLVIAGNPPVIESTGCLAVNLYRDVIADLRSRVDVISLDAEKAALANCLSGAALPDAVKINEAEYTSVDPRLWDDFAGTLVVTDSRGCRLWLKRSADQSMRIDGVGRPAKYSTIGAGDAMHAGFALARWVWGWDLERAARYGQAAAAASVGSADGTRGVTRAMVDELFALL